jgi:arginine/lysine/ornithine decarboxylase
LQLEAAVGRICGEFVVPYPPGIPIVVPGELITKQVTSQLYEYYSAVSPEKSAYEVNVLRNS